MIETTELPNAAPLASRHQRKTLMMVVIAALLATLMGLVPSESASAHQGVGEQVKRSDRCITKTEFRRVKRGHSVSRVRSIVGTAGKTTSHSSFNDGDAWKTKEFKACGRKYSYVSVSLEKTEYQRWVSNWICFDWDGDGIEEDCEDFGYYETRYRMPFVVTSKTAFWG